ncbi:MAG: hypothetical protein M1837_000743 [Sclerophora amabilis]|nr:MAG: hypothetical protein M1837_000743 [Sclerophora amabilis]
MELRTASCTGADRGASTDLGHGPRKLRSSIETTHKTDGQTDQRPAGPTDGRVVDIRPESSNADASHATSRAQLQQESSSFLSYRPPTRPNRLVEIPTCSSISSSIPPPWHDFLINTSLAVRSSVTVVLRTHIHDNHDRTIAPFLAIVAMFPNFSSECLPLEPSTPRKNAARASRGPTSPSARLSQQYSAGSQENLFWELHPAKRTFSYFGQSFRAINVKRWDGSTRLTTQWDGLRRDPELWFPDGDCLVYLYGRGQSRRGPSFRLPLAAIKSANCQPLFETHATQTLPDSPVSVSSSSSSDGGYFTNPTSARNHELFIPAPPHCTKEESFQYHLTTRNFFAWMFCKPIVGAHLGKALVSLLDRMAHFRAAEEDNVADLLDYLDEEAYADFRECPDHALAVLHLAEELEQRELWIDAFCHCVGMHDRLVSSTEFEGISRVSKALLTRAKLEMDIRLDHAGRQLTAFLDNELSGAYLGLGNGSRTHLDRFRSFLHSYYVGKFGYWPPPAQADGKSSISKSTYRAMYVEFRDLYEYLVDDDSTSSMENTVRPPSGGLCVLQNVAAFDKRHRYLSLPHPLPRLPEDPQHVTRQRSLNPQKLSRSFGKAAKADRCMSTLAALSAATNSYKVSVMESSLVRAYMRFEKECTMKGEDKVTPSEARKVRWILIYAILQTLISVTRAPVEVRDTEHVSYNLCCQIAGTPPWSHGGVNGSKEKLKRERSVLSRSVSARPPQSAKSIPPVPRAPENSTTHSSASSCSDVKVEIVPDTDPLPPPQPATLVRSRGISIKSPQPRRLASPASWCEILIHGYGNGTVLATKAASNAINQTVTPENESPFSTAGHSSQPSSSPISPMQASSSSRWSLSSNEGDDDILPEMDHLSVDGGSSYYGDDHHHVESNPAEKLSEILVSTAEIQDGEMSPSMRPPSLSFNKTKNTTNNTGLASAGAGDANHTPALDAIQDDAEDWERRNIEVERYCADDRASI